MARHLARYGGIGFRHIAQCDVEFGHMEAVGLVSGTKYSEKQVGYLVTSVLLNESNEFLRIVINSMRKGASPARARRPPPWRSSGR